MKKAKLNKLTFKEIEQHNQASIVGGQRENPSERGYRTYKTCDNCGDTYTVYYLDGSVHYTEYEAVPCDVNMAFLNIK